MPSLRIIMKETQPVLRAYPKSDDCGTLGFPYACKEGTQMPDDDYGVGPDDQIPDALWVQMVRVLPPPRPQKQDGRPRMDDRHAMTAIRSV